MSSVVLATLNAKYIHASFGLRYLAANMGPLGDRTRLLEFTIHERPADVAEAILAEEPAIVGLGVYIWNVEETAALVELLRRLAPKLVVVVGGPEVSYEIDDQPWLARVDYIVRGEGERAFAELCSRVLAGRRPLTRVIDGGLPELDRLALPYELYTDDDLRDRVLYTEASRGCPYRCEFCLSSLDARVRSFELAELFGAWERLLGRGARRFKFVDRTFNLDIERSAAILEFFLARAQDGVFVHFEMVPDRLPPPLRELIARFPPGAVQLEVGVQTLDAEVGARIQRRQKLERTFENLRFVREHTGAHLHVDLIIGLPGESLAGFGAGLDRLIALGVQEIQVGVLKRLRGTPIGRHADEFGMVFDGRPPYSILRSDAIDFATMQRLKRFALVWDVFWNRGDLPRSMARLWAGGSAFERSLGFSDWLFGRLGRVHAISLENRARMLVEYLVEERGEEREEVVGLVRADFEGAGRRVPRLSGGGKGRSAGEVVPKRQRRHLSAG